MSESKDLEWFFFCAPHRKYKTGSKVARVAKYGYWKSTGEVVRVVEKRSSRVVGKRRTLVFYEGKLLKGDRTNWVMHEYGLEDKTLAEADASICQDRFVVCKIFEKSGRGPKNGEQHGAHYVEEDDDDSDDDGSDHVSGSSMTHPFSIPSASSHVPEEGQDAAMISSTLDSGDGQDSTFPQHSDAPVVCAHHSSLEHDVHGDTSNGNDVQQADSIVMNKTIVDDADTHESLKWLEEELNSVDWEDENWLRQMLPSVGEGCFIEMNDIDVGEPPKVEGHQACVSDTGISTNVLGFHSTPVLPTPEVMDGSSESNFGGMEAISDSALLHKKGEIQGPYGNNSLGRGKRIKVLLSWECVCIGGGSFLNGHFLLGFIPACSASVEGYPPSLECEYYIYRGGWSSWGSNIKDEVTVTCFITQCKSGGTVSIWWQFHLFLSLALLFLMETLCASSRCQTW